jgi:hypothetical protein
MLSARPRVDLIRYRWRILRERDREPNKAMSDSDIREVQRVLGLLSSGNADVVSLALRRFRLGPQRQLSEDAFVDYVVGLESILAASADRSEVTFKLALRLATLIGVTAEDRLRIFKRAKELYDTRSGLLHGRKTKTLDADTAELRQYLKSLIMAVLTYESDFRPEDVEKRLLRGELNPF